MEDKEIQQNDREILAQSISQFRRATMREFLLSVLHLFEDFDFSLPQLATLLLLDEEGDLTIKQVAEALGRSVSATSRLLDVLFEHGLTSRREDQQDRRARRVSITERGKMLLAIFEKRRAEAQLAVMDYLLPQEQADIVRAMVLLAEAGKRRRKDEPFRSGTGAIEHRQHSDE
ncbi:MAG TPA: MarR family transcriptional regulator [Ktedonobacteraceae bacterium]|nr:MarR family transcriptional regulator [Ktedonobacteraceae bacterium]